MRRKVWALLDLEDGQTLEGLEVLAQVPVSPLECDIDDREGILEGLEDEALDVGQRVSQETLCVRWAATDARFVARHMAAHSQSWVWRDGLRPIKVVTRAGTVYLDR